MKIRFPDALTGLDLYKMEKGFVLQLNLKKSSNFMEVDLHIK